MVHGSFLFLIGRGRSCVIDLFVYLRKGAMNSKSVVAFFVVMIFISWVQEVEPESLPPHEGSAWLVTVIVSSNPDLIGESHYHAFHKGQYTFRGSGMP